MAGFKVLRLYHIPGMQEILFNIPLFPRPESKGKGEAVGGPQGKLAPYHMGKIGLGTSTCVRRILFDRCLSKGR